MNRSSCKSKTTLHFSTTEVVVSQRAPLPGAWGTHYILRVCAGRATARPGMLVCGSANKEQVASRYNPHCPSTAVQNHPAVTMSGARNAGSRQHTVQPSPKRSSVPNSSASPAKHSAPSAVAP